MLGHFNCTLPLLGNSDSAAEIFLTACYQYWEILILILGFLPLLKKLDSNDVIFQTVCYHYQEIRIPVLEYFQPYIPILRNSDFIIGIFQTI